MILKTVNTRMYDNDTSRDTSLIYQDVLKKYANDTEYIN